MLLHSPTALHYPITVTELLKRPNDDVERSAPLFWYAFKSTVTEGNEYGEEKQVEKTFPTLFESQTDGRLLTWKIDKGTVIKGPGVALAEIEEPCTHDVQYGGMCVNCGKDLTEIDYISSVPDTQRANTSVAHVHSALRISAEEAARIDEEAKQRLLDTRKLSLVVDLDLTVIHASVDPTIGEWQSDDTNPNHQAVQDVKSFELYDDALQRNVSYYIKLRPNWKSFFEQVSKRYELHIYTMATRAYADNIAKLLDPDKKLFGDRIISRTETPGEDSKSLQKLFPVDNKMVVIIDDRADVWKWSNYLVRVRPFNFFVGIGDINSSFLPKRDDLMAAPHKDSPPDPRKDQNEGAKHKEPKPKPPASDGSNGEQADGDESTLGQIVSMQDESNDAAAMQRKTAEQDENLAAQLNDRPLLRLQHDLERAEEEALEQDAAANGDSGDRKSPTRSAGNLLKDDDDELSRVQGILLDIQRRFYDQYDTNMIQYAGDRSSSNSNTSKAKPSRELQRLVVPDVKEVIEPFKTQTLRGCRLVFSRVVPLNEDVFKTRWADLAIKLGADIQKDVTADTTHVVAKPGDPTSKMRQAAARGSVHIVTVDWLWESSTRWWERVDETPYEIVVDPGPEKKRRRIDGGGGGGDSAFPSARSSDDEGDGAEYDHDDTRLGRGALGIDVAAAVNASPSDAPPSPDGDLGDKGWDQAFEDDDEDDYVSDEDDSAAQSDASELSTSSRAQKRKRDRTGDTTDSDAGGTAGAQGLGSRLQRRKRQALARSSSLTTMAMVDRTPEPERRTNGRKGAEEDGDDEDGDGGGGVGVEGDDDFDAAMRAAMDAASDEEDASDDGG